jgi:hypothetical protein
MSYYKKHWIPRMIFFGIAAIAVFSLVVMLLWNWLIPAIFNGPSITYIQSLGLLVLSHILFNGFGRSFRHSHDRRNYFWRKKFQDKLDKMTPEEREEFKKKCGWWNGGYHEKDDSAGSTGTHTA